MVTEPARHPGRSAASCLRPTDLTAAAARTRDPRGLSTDPEIPTVSIVDLGPGSTRSGRPNRVVAVELLPTFVACPALEVIREDVTDAPRRISVAR